MALAVLVFLFYWKVIFGHSIFVFVDASRFFYPLWKWGSDVLKQGWIPLWNRDAQFGTPYLADPQMAYAYPPVPLLYSALSPLNAFAALTILHHFWALLGFWVFARHQGFSAKASFLGSLVFGFSLHVVCSSWTPVALMTISWIPWVFYAVEKIFRGERNGFIFLSLTWAMQLAAGYPVLVYLTVLAVGMHLIWKIITNSPPPKGADRGKPLWTLKTKIPFVKRGRKGINPNIPPFEKGGVGGFNRLFWIGKILAAGLVAVAYNLVWGLPFAEFFRLSNYENGANRFQDLGWLDFATILSPFDQGHPLLTGYHGPHYWVSTYFIGLPALCLLLWGAFHLTRKKTSWGILLFLLVLSLGVLGLGHFLRAFFPGYSLVIHSGYWLALFIFWTAWLVVESADGLMNKPLPLENGLFWMGIVIVVFFASFLLSLFAQAPISLAAFGCSFGLALIAPFLRRSGFRWGVLMLALVLSLGTAARSVNILLDKSYYEKPSESLALLTKPGRLFFTPPLLKEAVLLQGDNMEQAYEAAKEKLYPNWPLEFEREEAPVYNTLQLKGSFAWTFQAFQYSLEHSRKVLDYLGIRYVFGKNQFKDFKKINQAGGLVEISENPTPLPKWFSVSRAIAGGSSLEDDFLRAGHGKMNYGKECFIADASGAGFYNPRKVEVQASRPDHLEITAVGKEKALIVSSETAYPGWRARVNGMERSVETINHSFRGIVLNDGETQASISYEPVTFCLGLYFSLLVCGLWVCLGLKRH